MFSKKSLISALYDHQTAREYHKFIRGMYLNVRPPVLSAVQNREYRNFWMKLHKRTSLKWIEIYQYLTGIISNYYVADDIYHTRIEPVMNYLPMAKMEASKTRYSINYPGIRFPKTLLFNEDGEFYDAEGNNLSKSSVNAFIEIIRVKYGSVIIKPALDSGGGRDVQKYANNGNALVNADDEKLSLSCLEKFYQRDYVLQSVIRQHEFFARYNPNSVNALRIFTYRSIVDESIQVLHSIIKIGGLGSYTNNLSSGGVSIGIDEGGFLRNYAVDLKGNKYLVYNGISLQDKQKIPGYQSLLDTARKIASKMHYSRFVGVDLIIDDQGDIIVIEVNNDNHGINCYQMNNGPLFGKFTKEIVDYCASHPRSYCFDYLLQD